MKQNETHWFIVEVFEGLYSKHILLYNPVRNKYKGLWLLLEAPIPPFDCVAWNSQDKGWASRNTQLIAMILRDFYTGRKRNG